MAAQESRRLIQQAFSLPRQTVGYYSGYTLYKVSFPHFRSLQTSRRWFAIDKEDCPLRFDQYMSPIARARADT